VGAGPNTFGTDMRRARDAGPVRTVLAVLLVPIFAGCLGSEGEEGLPATMTALEAVGIAEARLRAEGIQDAEALSVRGRVALGPWSDAATAAASRGHAASWQILLQSEAEDAVHAVTVHGADSTKDMLQAGTRRLPDGAVDIRRLAAYGLRQPTLPDGIGDSDALVAALAAAAGRAEVGSLPAGAARVHLSIQDGRALWHAAEERTWVDALTLEIADAPSAGTTFLEAWGRAVEDKDLRYATPVDAYATKDPSLYRFWSFPSEEAREAVVFHDDPVVGDGRFAEWTLRLRTDEGERLALVTADAVDWSDVFPGTPAVEGAGTDRTGYVDSEVVEATAARCGSSDGHYAYHAGSDWAVTTWSGDAGALTSIDPYLGTLADAGRSRDGLPPGCMPPPYAVFRLSGTLRRDAPPDWDPGVCGRALTTFRLDPDNRTIRFLPFALHPGNATTRAVVHDVRIADDASGCGSPSLHLESGDGEVRYGDTSMAHVELRNGTVFVDGEAWAAGDRRGYEVEDTWMTSRGTGRDQGTLTLELLGLWDRWLGVSSEQELFRDPP